MLSLLMLATMAAEPNAAEPERWAVYMTFSPSTPSLSFGGVTFQTGGSAGGVVGERVLTDHLSVLLSVDGGVSGSPTQAITGARVGATPGVRWYLTKPLEGGWFGAAVPVSYFVGGGMTTFGQTTAVSVSFDLLLGWTARLGSSVRLSIGGGPTVSINSFGATTLTPAGSSYGIGLKASLSVGFAF
jgi:hypothetical protein